MSRASRRAAWIGAGAAVATIAWAAPAIGATADLSVDKSDGPDPVAVGAELTYTVQVANAGPEEAAAIEVVDELPNKLDFVSAITTQGACDRQGKRVTCTIGPLANGGTATVTIRVRTRADGLISNTATVRSEPDADPALANNTDTETTTVVARSGLPQCAGRNATIVGTSGADVLVGTGGRDVIAAFGGDDLIRGVGGNDVVCGAGGKDRIRGGNGRDLLRGGGGKDRIFGGAGRDALRGGAGRDVCRGGPGRDSKRGC